MSSDFVQYAHGTRVIGVKFHIGYIPYFNSRQGISSQMQMSELIVINIGCGGVLFTNILANI